MRAEHLGLHRELKNARRVFRQSSGLFPNCRGTAIATNPTLKAANTYNHHQMKPKGIRYERVSRSSPTDAEVRAILLDALVKAGGTPAAAYAFHKTGVLLTDDNEKNISRNRLRAWNRAIQEYHALVAGPVQ